MTILVSIASMDRNGPGDRSDPSGRSDRSKTSGRSGREGDWIKTLVTPRKGKNYIERHECSKSQKVAAGYILARHHVETLY